MNAAQQFGQTVGRPPVARSTCGVLPCTGTCGRPANSLLPLLLGPAHRGPSHGRNVTGSSILHSERFRDKASPEVFATLLDEGTYLCSLRTVYRILKESGEVRERRSTASPQLSQTPVASQRPQSDLELGPHQAARPREVDLFYFYLYLYLYLLHYLYVILDIFSRYVVGWMVAERESAELAKRLIGKSCRKQNIVPDQLTLHADRWHLDDLQTVRLAGGDLGVTKPTGDRTSPMTTHSRKGNSKR